MKKTLLLLSILLGLFISESKATHMMGSDITYECLGNNKFRITLKIYRDCTGINLGGINCTVRSGTYSATFQPTKISVKDLSNVCDTATSLCDSSSTSRSGIGIEVHTYQETIDISKAPYTTWVINGACEFTFGWGQCCRNGEITTINNGSFYSEAMINVCNIKKTSNLCNNSPTFNGDPVFFACCNSPLFYNYQVSEATEYDSLSFELTAPQSSPGTDMTYKSPFSKSVPMTPKCTNPSNVNCTPNPNANPPIGFYFNKSNGDMVFTPSKCDEVGIIVMKVKEWRKDKTGTYVHIGTVRRDMQIVVQNCTGNNPPTVTSNKYEYTVCEGDQIKINIEGKDVKHSSGKSDTVTMSWGNSIPNATFTVTNPSSREKKAEFVWQTKIGDAKSIPYTFAVKATDDACPLNVSSGRGFSITVLPRSSGKIMTTSNCGSKDLEFDFMLDKNAPKPTSYLWKFFDSANKTVGTSNNKITTLSSLSDGKYYAQLTVINSHGCSKIIMDTIDFKYIAKSKTLNLGNDTTITDKDSLLLNAGNGFTNYKWNDNSTLQSLLIDGNVVGAGTYLYWVNTVDSIGCIYIDSIYVIVSSTLGINDWNKNNLIVYPTPTKDNLTIELPTNFNKGKVAIYSVTGQVILSQDINDIVSSKYDLNISHLPKGAYVLRLSTSGNEHVIKIIKD